MRAITLSLLSLFLGTSAMAAELGSACGLTDSKDDTWVETRSIGLTRSDEAQVSNLPTLTKQQLIIAANDFASSSGSPVRFRSAWDAVRALREHSDANTVSIVYYDVNGTRVTEVLHYPGDNPYGVLFATGSRSIIARNGDDTIVCN